MDSRNITLHLPTDLVRQAKIYAAQHDTTVNSLVRELLEAKLSSEGRTRAAINRLLVLAEEGPHFQGDPGTIRREELHERR